MKRPLRRVESLVSRRHPEYGRKAQNLAKLARSGFPVPAAWALSAAESNAAVAAALTDFGVAVNDLDALLYELASEKESQLPTLANLGERVRSTRLPPDLSSGLEEVMNDLRSRGASVLAVRSSSLMEDETEAAAAGVHLTQLGISSLTELEAAVCAVWASLFRPEAIAYRRRMAVSVSWGMGVVIQAMVPAEVSGVAFTANPITGDPSELLVSASYGLGGPVVDGSIAPDMFTLHRKSGVLADRVLGAKREQLVLRQASVRRIKVGARRRAEFCLDESTLAALCSLCLRVEDRFLCPQDIEWSLAGGNFYVLQARPISAMKSRQAYLRNALRWTRSANASSSQRELPKPALWSNANVGEALPGVVTPLTWSVLSSFGDHGFRHVLTSIGCAVPRDAKLVGNVRGRVYLNMTELMSVLSTIPGLSPSLLVKLGGSELEGQSVPQLEQSYWRSFGFLARLPWVASRLLGGGLELGGRVERLALFFEEEQRRFEALDLRVLSPVALSKALRDVEKLLEVTGHVLLTCYGRLLVVAVVFWRVLPRALKRKERAKAEELSLKMFSGLSNVVSAVPSQELKKIAELARQEPAVVDQLIAKPLATSGLNAFPKGRTRRALEEFLAKHGHRGAREAELAEPRWREDITLLLAALRGHVECMDDPSAQQDRAGCTSARNQQALKELAESARFYGQWSIRPLLSELRKLLRLREALRSRVVEVLGMMRLIALEVDRRLRAVRPTAEPGDVFFLTVDEVHQLLEDAANVAQIPLEQRKALHERFAAMPDPPTAFVGYPPTNRDEIPEAADSNALLHRGLACSGGTGQGQVRTLEKPSDAAGFRAGEVLVIPRADVGYTPLFATAAAVVTELGGPLSHASVVARELGVPLVCNLRGATRLLQTGDLVRVDGNQGTVEKVFRQ